MVVFSAIGCREMIIRSRFVVALLSIEKKGECFLSFVRVNPFPEVTDLFCRLPLSTLFYQLEATNLGDLMRL